MNFARHSRPADYSIRCSLNVIYLNQRPAGAGSGGTVPLEEAINEPLDWVEVRFEAGRIEPVRFRWKTREFDVARVLSFRLDRSARPNRMTIGVRVTTGESMELT